MIEYIFLYVLAGIWILFAVIQDMRTREVANWLTYSLIAFVLAYRAFYAIAFDDAMFFVFGLFGVGIFIGLGFLFYYAKVFAGGDAKLLMGLGGILPFEKYFDLVYLGVSYIFLLFAAGIVWTLIFSVYLLNKKGNWKKFKREFGKEFKKSGKYVIGFFVIVLVLLVFVLFKGFNHLLILFLIVLLLLPLLWIYAKSLERSCMIVWKSVGELTVGDWLEKEVKIGKGVIKKSVHGLSLKDIAVLKKANKKVLIKEGVPFTPAFLIAWAFGLFI